MLFWPQFDKEPMISLRGQIRNQYLSLGQGRIFTIQDLSFDKAKTGHVAVYLSQQCKKGEIVRISRGAYYVPQTSVLGLGRIPVYEDEEIRFLLAKIGGYLSGAKIYNQMGLTEQVSSTVTIACPNPRRRFRYGNLDVECVKAYGCAYKDVSNLPYLHVLDALKDIRHISGRTAQEVYDKIKEEYFSLYSKDELDRVISLTVDYPPRVRKIVSDILSDIGNEQGRRALTDTLLPTTHYKLGYVQRPLI